MQVCTVCNLLKDLKFNTACAPSEIQIEIMYIYNITFYLSKKPTNVYVLVNRCE